MVYYNPYRLHTLLHELPMDARTKAFRCNGFGRFMGLGFYHFGFFSMILMDDFWNVRG